MTTKKHNDTATDETLPPDEAKQSATAETGVPPGFGPRFPMKVELALSILGVLQRDTTTDVVELRKAATKVLTDALGGS